MMKKQLTSWLAFSLFILSAIFLAAEMEWHHWTQEFLVSWVFFFLVGLGSLYLLLSNMSKDNGKRNVQLILLSVTFKMLGSLFFLLILWVVLREGFKPYGIAWIILYLPFTVAETISLLKNLNRFKES